MKTGLRTTFFTTLLLVLGLVSFAFGVNVGFASASDSGDESATSVNITVNLASDPGAVSYVQYSVTGGTATGSGTDYTLANGTLTFPLSDTSEDIILTVVDDALDENNETVIITLSAPAGGADGLGTSVHTYTINDNDATPSVQFTSSSLSGSESVTPANMELTLSAASGLTVTVSYTVGAGTATSGGTDYSLASGTATINAGQTTTNISATINNDILDENNETINVTISGPSNATLGTNTAFTYTITDDDASPEIQVTPTSASGSEAVSPVIIQLIISAISGRDASANYSLSGTASGSGTDYTLASGTATVTAGNNTVDLSATINNDILDENNETLILTISDPTNCTIGTNSTHTYTITDNDATPTVQFTSTTAQGAESITPVTMQLQLSAASGLDVSVNYAISGTATGSGTDYTMAAGSATISAGGTTTDLSATIIDDTIDENDETLIVTISSPSNATLGGNTTHTYTLQDNDATPSIEATLASSSGSEGITPANIEVTLSAASGLDATVDYAVSGTATGSGTDYTLANGTATITAGGTTTNISPTINDDALDEAGETIILTLSNPSNASLGTNTTHTFTINDNDDPPTIQFSAASSNGDEGASPATLTLQLPTASSLAVTADYAVSGTATGGGTDYTLAAGTATITAGQTTTTVSATINDDALDEDDETIIVTISNPSNATLGTNNIHTYTITDNDPQTSIQFSSTTSTGTEGTASVNFELAIAATAGRDITVDYAVSGTATGTGTDYTLAAGTATITSGSTTTNVTASVVEDGLDENDETIILTISNPTSATLGTNTTHTYTITDNDNPPTVQFTSTTSNGGEATTPANLEVSLSTASGLDVTIDYTASGGTATGSGTDYTLADGTLTISAGSTTGNISPTINDDALDENDETIIVTISNPTNSTLGTNTTHTYTITDDDDPPTVAFSTTSSSATESTTPATLTISLSSASGLAVTVDYALSGTAGGSNVDYSLPAGTATISAGGTGTTLSATITNDEVVEDDETIIVTISNPTNSTLGANTTHTYTITNDDTGPAAFTVGTVTTTGGSIVSGYWNATNTGVNVVVPVENNSDLDGGTIQLQAKRSTSATFENLGDSYTITAGDIPSSQTMSVTATQFEAITGFDEENVTIDITAVITDQNTNSTTGTTSSTTIIVDQLAPTLLIVGTVSATGGNETSGYWNITNTDVDVVVPLTSGDASLANGTVQLQAEADGTFENLGAASTISGAELSAGTKTVEVDSGGTASTDVEELTGFGDGDVLEFKAVVTDIAGNATTFTKSSSTLTVDQTIPTISSVTSSNSDGYYNINDQITVQIITTETATVTGTPKLTLETGTSDAEVNYSSGSPGTTLSFIYTVSENEESSDLNYGTTGDLALNGGSIRDAAGNDLDLTLPSLAGPNSLGDNKALVVDGVVPADFTVGAVTTVGGTVVSGYWNSTNTSLKVIVPLDATDTSLSGGTIQLEAEADGTFENLGSSVTIAADSVTAGQQTISIQSTGTVATDFEELTGLSDGDEITFRASIGDVAGNGTQGTASSTSLSVDQTVPTAFTVGVVSPIGGNVFSGYWNGTNTSMSVTVPLESADLTLVGGSFRIQAKAGAAASYENIADIFTIQNTDVSAGSRTVTVDSSGTDSTDVEELSGFTDGISIYITTILTDVAGNSTTGTESDSTLSIDQTAPQITNVTSSISDGSYTVDDSIQVKTSISENVYLSGTPQLTLETGSVDAVIDYSTGNSTDTLQFVYIVDENQSTTDLDYLNTTALSLTGTTVRDIAGNDLETTLPTPGQSGSLGANKDIIIDTAAPSAEFQYANLTQTNLVDTGNSDDDIRVTATFSEQIDNSPSPTLSVEYADSTNDSFVDLAPQSSTDNDSVWVYQFTLPDSSINDGIMAVTITASDLAGNQVSTLIDSQKFVIDNTPPQDFDTGNITPIGLYALSGWINNSTDTIQVTVPVPSATSDPSLLNGGKVDIQLFNLTRGTQWKTTGTADSLTQGGNLLFYRTVNEIETVLVPDTDLIQGDSIIVRAFITDRVGNSTIGDASVDTLVYDPNRPVIGSVVGGVVFEKDTIVSNDTISVIWSSFIDPTPTTASGINYYEWAVEELGSGTIIGFQDWTDVGLDTSDSSILPLVHNKGYRVHIRAFDNAGNPSDTLSYNPPDSLLRLNSAPVFVTIDSQSVDEDVLFTYQVSTTDVDLATLLGDTLHYTILDTGITGASNAMNIDESSGLLSWNTPLQADTGSYTVDLLVTDEWQIPGSTTNYADTASFVLTVNSVNDTPQVLAAFPDTLIFDEDESTTQALNLTQYVDDVDNNDTTEITWSALVMPDTVTYPSYPILFIGPGATPQLENAIRNFIFGDFGKTGGLKGGGLSNGRSDAGLTVQISATADSVTTTFVADSNYYVENREVIFIATDSDGASDSTHIFVTITAFNDPPVITAISDTTVLENDTLQLVLRATDLDNSTLIFQVIPDSSQIVVQINDSIATFIPQSLWSYRSNILVIVSDDSSSDSTSFLLDIIRVTRPHLALSLGQNTIFSRYFEFMITDTAEKALDVDLTINPLGVSVTLEQLSTSGSGEFTWVGNHEFDTTGTFSFVMDATALVGDTTITRSSQMTLAKAKSGWVASSSDGSFRIIAETGTVPVDQPLMIIDSLLFPLGEQDGGLYHMGNPLLTFNKSVMVLLPNNLIDSDEDQAIYQKGFNGKWKEVPTVLKRGELMAWTSEMGYFKMGKKTILVPEKTTLGNNYPNPFNAQTKIVFDIGFFGGPDQKTSIIIYNLLGQEVKSIHNGPMAIGHHELVWNGGDNFNIPVSSGIYFIRLMTNRGISQTKKMMLLR